MADVQKLLYIVVVDEGVSGGGDGEEGKEQRSSSFRYTRSGLQSTLQLMGCKARHAFKISRRVFDVMRCSDGSLSPDATSSDLGKTPSNEENESETTSGSGQANMTNQLTGENVDTSCAMPFELYKRLTTVVCSMEHFLDVVCGALEQYKYFGPNQRADLLLACRIREKKESVTVLLCGTSGCGKSTLSSLLGSRLGITTVISTDSIRHMMRSFVDEKQNPLLWSSTYHAGECLDPVAVSEAKAKRKAKKLAVVSHTMVKEEAVDGASNEKPDGRSHDLVQGTELIGKKRMAIEGFKAQSEMVIDSLDRLITAWEERKESVIVEGVHLSLNFVMGLMKKHPSIIPFMIYITNEEKHMERFAVRAKYMTLEPAKNKYVKYIQNIRAIQEYLCKRADKHLVPKVNNTNVDRSVAAIHATVFGCLRRREAGEQLYDPTTNTVSVIHDEYRNQCAADTLSSKGMFQLIQRQGSSRHLMALVNTDGSVAKAWPVETVGHSAKFSSGNGSEKSVGNPMYGPLQIGKAEPVNLQFGNFGISAWPNDTCGTSQTGSIDDPRADGTDTGSRYFSSCCSSPKGSDSHAKELKEEIFVSGSEEEEADYPDRDSDEDFSDIDQENHDEVAGSVDENSTKSDEEYEDLAMQDDMENGYRIDEDDDELTNLQKIADNGKTPVVDDGIAAEKYQNNLDLFLKMSMDVVEPPFAYASLPERNRKGTSMTERRRTMSDSIQFQSQTKIITSIGE